MADGDRIVQATAGLATSIGWRADDDVDSSTRSSTKTGTTAASIGWQASGTERNLLTRNAGGNTGWRNKQFLKGTLYRASGAGWRNNIGNVNGSYVKSTHIANGEMLYAVVTSTDASIFNFYTSSLAGKVAQGYQGEMAYIYNEEMFNFIEGRNQPSGEFAIFMRQEMISYGTYVEYAKFLTDSWYFVGWVTNGPDSGVVMYDRDGSKDVTLYIESVSQIAFVNLGTVANGANLQLYNYANGVFAVKVDMPSNPSYSVIKVYTWSREFSTGSVSVTPNFEITNIVQSDLVTFGRVTSSNSLCMAYTFQSGLSQTMRLTAFSGYGSLYTNYNVGGYFPGSDNYYVSEFVSIGGKDYYISEETNSVYAMSMTTGAYNFTYYCPLESVSQAAPFSFDCLVGFEGGSRLAGLELT